MNIIDAFLTDYRHLFSLVNGIAFFSLGLSIILVSESSNKPRLFGPLRVLSGYGFMAALANWLRMFMLTQGSTSQRYTFLETARLLSFIAAAVLLLRYATQAISGQNKRYQLVRWLFHVASVLYVVVIIFLFVGPASESGNWVATADVYTRTLFLLPGFIMTAIGLWGEYRSAKAQNLLRISKDLLGACVAFILKALTSGLFAFPVFSSSQLLPPAVTLAIHLSRVVSTSAVAFFIVRVIRDYEFERNSQYTKAVEQRFKAQQETLTAQRQVTAEIERWSRQLEDLVDNIATAMSQVTSLGDILDVSLRKVLELTKFDAGDILLVHTDASELQLITQNGLSEAVQECRMSLGLRSGQLGDISASDGYVVMWNLVEDPNLGLRLGKKTLKDIQSSGETVVVWNLSEDPKLAGTPCRAAGFCCLVNVLITCRGNILGVMNLLGKSNSLPQANELRVLSAIGQQIGVAIENARLYEQVQSVAALEERERLGRELHDGLAQVLGFLHIKSYNVNELLRSGQVAAAQAELGEMQEVARQTQREVREAILGLRTTIKPETGILTTLTEYTDRFSQQSGIHTQLVTIDDAVISFDPVVEIQLLRIVQEALTNTRKHSGANQAVVKLKSKNDDAIIIIKDDGQGFDPEQINQDEHYGVYTMKERAQSVGGETKVLSEPGHGTKIVVRLPLKQFGR